MTMHRNQNAHIAGPPAGLLMLHGAVAWTMEEVGAAIAAGRPLLVVHGSVLDLAAVPGGTAFVSAHAADCALFSNFTSAFSRLFGARSPEVLAQVQACAVGTLAGSDGRGGNTLPPFTDPYHPAWTDSVTSPLNPSRPPATNVPLAAQRLAAAHSRREDVAAAAAVLGAIVGDAAAVPNHWCYDQAKIAAQFGGTDPPEFLEPGINAYYSLPAGASSCYGDQVRFYSRLHQSNDSFPQAISWMFGFWFIYCGETRQMMCALESLTA